jgi:hypothetical protein
MKKLLLILLCLPILFNSCEDDTTTPASNNNNPGNNTNPSIGDYHQGGVIFYLDGNGGGLICDIEDLSASAGWGCQGMTITGADGTAIGTGAQNTIDIESECITANTAADKCANSTAQGYSDWFLPSQDELNEIFLSRLTINATATSNGGVEFETSYYWSSSEDGNQFALLQIFDSGIQDNSLKNLAFYVRAIRAF